jgi:hypothetical protein
VNPSRPIIAAVLLIISVVLTVGLIVGLALLDPGGGTAEGDVTTLDLAIFLMVLLSLPLSVVGAVLALQKNAWGVTLACAAAGIFNLALMPVNSVLALVATILIFTSKPVFRS